MNMAIWFAIINLCLGIPFCAERDSTTKLKRLDGTAQLELTGTFLFCISPNDQWLVFFWRGDPDVPELPETHYLYGRLRVVNLRTGTVYPFTLREDQVSMAPLDDDHASWASDSSMCVLPPPAEKDRRVVIRIGSDEKPTLTFIPHPHQPPKPGEVAPDEQIKLPERFTCSDCSPHVNDLELLRRLIPMECQFGGRVMPGENTHAVSFDGKKIFYQKGPQQDANIPGGNTEAILHEIDVATGTSRVLVTHRGDSPMIDELRPSPDGKKLAYQVTFGQNFVSIPEIYVLELTTLKAEQIALGGDSMRWTSTSDKLYFYRQFLEAPAVDYLWVAEFGKADPPPKQP